MSLSSIIEKLNGPLPMGKFRGIQLATTPLSIMWFLVLGFSIAWWLPVVLFATVALHEYGHVLVGERFKYKTVVLLFEPMGAQVVMKPRVQTASDDMRIAVAGPLVNLAIGLFLLPIAAIMYYAGYDGSSAFMPIAVTCAMNFAFGLYNLLPIYPMDGGRIFRAWAIKKYGWERGSKLTRNVGISVGTALVGIMWLRKNRIGALLALPHILDCVRGLRAQERLRQRQDPFARLDEWAKHQKRQQES